MRSQTYMVGFFRHGFPCLCLALLFGCYAARGDDPLPRQGPVATQGRDTLRQKLHGLEKALPAQPPADDTLRHPWAQAQLHLRKARYILEQYYPGAWSENKVAGEIAAAEEALSTYRLKETLLRISRQDPAVKGTAWWSAVKDPFQHTVGYGFASNPDIFAGVLTPAPQPGFFEAAYWCDLDGSAQPYVGFIPSSYDGRTAYPLLVYLHGYSPLLDIVNWSELSPDMLDVAEKYDFLVVAPFARGNTDFQGIGEMDVLRVIDEMQQRHRVDADRIILVGYSMGGMGAWTIAAHYPHRFAGALIVSGRACYYTWHGVSRNDLPYYKQAFIDMEFGHSLLPNLKNMPILCYHGEYDLLVPLKEARVMARALQPLNPNFQYTEIKGGEHWMFNDIMRKPATRHWLKSQRRSRPETFRHVTWHPRYRRAHWLSLSANAPAGVRREVSVTQEADRWVIRTENAGTVWLHPDRLPTSIIPADIVTEPGVTLKTATIAETAYTARDDGFAPPRGPLKEFFLAPFMFVQAGDPNDTDAASKRFDKRCREWEQYAQAPPRRAREADIDDQKRRDYNLFLFGEPESSPMIRHVLQQAPIDVSAGEYIVGDTVVPRDGHGLLMVYRSPWHPNRMVAVQCGHPWGEHLSVNHRYDYLPDYIVYDAKPDRDGSNRAWIAGFFDLHWQLHTNTIYIAETIPEHPQPLNDEP